MSKPHNVLIVALAATLGLLSGCTGSTAGDAPTASADQDDCVEDSPGQVGVADISPGESYTTVPGFGHMGGGQQVHFEWRGEEARLRRVNVTMTWEVPTGGQEWLGFKLDDGNDTTAPREDPWFEGPSPLTAEVWVNGTSTFGDALVVVVGTAHQGPTPLGTTALVRQDVLLVAVQGYAC